MAINTAQGGAGTVITDYDLWRLAGSISLATNDVLSGSGTWERPDNPTGGYVGSGVSLSGGSFTFPKTGLWHINMVGGGYINGNVQFFGLVLDHTTNNYTNYTQLLMPYSNTAYNIGNPHTTVCSFCNLDVTDTTNQKVRLRTDTHGTFTWFGNTSGNMTAISFMRFGDT